MLQCCCSRVAAATTTASASRRTWTHTTIWALQNYFAEDGLCKLATRANPAKSADMTSCRQTVDAFVDAFNRNDLDGVMAHFSDDAVYLPGDGRSARGRSAIRALLQPQFAGAYGSMRFDEHDRVEDVAARKLTIRWTCRHDLTRARPAQLRYRLLHALVGTVLGRHFGWEGLDVFHFDEAGRICGKFSYANYPFPLLRAALG